MGFLDGYNRGLSGNYRYEIAGKTVVCSHCGGEEFDERSAQLNTARGVAAQPRLGQCVRSRARLPRLRPPGMVSVGGTWTPNSST